MDIDSAIALIESVRDYRVLFVGDTITDEYHYVKPLGKSPKEHLIPVRATGDKEKFNGGVHAAASHAASFCSDVQVFTSGPKVRKLRLVDPAYVRKLFEIHYMDGNVRANMPLLASYDVVVVADFGHSAITGQDITKLCEAPVFLAVNAQTNSSNIGFNLITKYPRADYIVIDEPEARLAAADRDGHIEDVMQKLAHGRCEKMVVTLGVKGAIGYENGQFYRSEPMTANVVDTMGAGDAFFAVTAPMAKKGRMEELLAIGNAAGAMKCQITGHRESIKKDALIEYLRANGTH